MILLSDTNIFFGFGMYWAVGRRDGATGCCVYRTHAIS